MKPCALIVGGTGFVGSHLARQLSNRYSIVATGRDHDVRDSGVIHQLVSETAPAIVVNLAAITTVSETIERPRETYDIAFFGLFNLLTALKSNGFKGRLLQASSSEVYGFPTSDELPLSELSSVRPMSPYSVAKAAAELLCQQWAQLRIFDVVVARPFTHIGPGQSNRFAAAKFSQQIAEIMTGQRNPIIAAGNLNTARDLTDVRDVVRAYDLILERGKHGNIYNVCTGREARMQDVLEELVRHSGKEIQITGDQRLMRQAEQQRICGSYAKLNAVTGWAPEIPLTRTLADILAFALKEATDGSVLKQG